MLIRDRRDAAERLGERLAHYGGHNPLVLAVPRGAVPMGRIIADRLGGELDVVLVSKLGAPHDPETAIAGVDEHGSLVLEPKAQRVGYTEAWLEREKAYRVEQLRRRAQRYRAHRSDAEPTGRSVIVVDDGVATGATLFAAIRSVRAHRPARLVVATAVAPRRLRRRLARAADEVVCLHAPWLLLSVNQVFRRFEPVDDEAVCRCLDGAA